MEKFLQAYHKTWPILALIVAHLIWGANFLAAKLTLQEIPPQSLGFLRFSLASIFLLPFLVSDPKSLKISKHDLPSLFLVGSMMVSLHIAFFYEGLYRTTITDAASLMLLVPILTVLIGWWFLKQKFNWLNLAGVISGLVGALMIVGLEDVLTQKQIDPSVLIGNFLIILSVLTWIVGAFLSKKLLSHYSTLTITWMMFLVGVITFSIPALNEYIQNPKWVTQVSLLGILGLAYITLGSSVSAYFLFEWGVKKVGVYKADLFQYIEPAVAGILGVLVLNESLESALLIGTALITVGALLGTYSQHAKQILHKAHRG